MALTIATGFVVDDAIVVTENVEPADRGRRAPARGRAARRARRSASPSSASRSSLLAVFIPILFMGGSVGRLFREFAVVLAISISLSAVISLTLTPMMCAQLLRAAVGAPRLDQARARARPGSARPRVRRRSSASCCATASSSASSPSRRSRPRSASTPRSRPGLFPQQDTGMLTGTTQGPQDISFPAMKARQETLIQIVLADPDVAHVNASVGGVRHLDDQHRPHVHLAPRQAARTASADEVIARLRPQARQDRGHPAVPAVGAGRPRRRPGVAARSTSTRSRAPTSPSSSGRPRSAPRSRRSCRRSRTSRPTSRTAGLQPRSADRSRRRSAPRHHRRADRQHALRRVRPAPGRDDVHADQPVPRGLRGRAGGRQRPRGARPHLRAPSPAVARCRSPSSCASGGPTSPLSVSHQGQFPSTTISFNIGARRGARAGRRRRRAAPCSRSACRRASTAAFSGTAQAFRDSLSTAAVPRADPRVIAVYIVLGVLYESYIHPITILSTLPSAGVGALLALLLTGSRARS